MTPSALRLERTFRNRLVLDGPRDGQAADWPLLELPALGLSEAVGDGEELVSAEVLLGVHRKLDPAGFTPGDLEEVVDRIVVEQGRVAVHGDGFPPGLRDEFALVS